MKKISWYFQRLGFMGGREVIWRVKSFVFFGADLLAPEFFRERMWGFTLLRKTILNQPMVEIFEIKAKELEGFEARKVIKDADDIVDGRLVIFNKPVAVGRNVNWLKDYFNNIEGEARPTQLVDYKNPRQNGDVKVVWELSRMQFLPTLALAHRLTGDQRYLEAIDGYISSWIKMNPFMVGINWGSSMEVGLRALSWTLALCILDPEARQKLCRRAEVVRSVTQHMCFISKKYSLFSSANNHLITEAAALYILCRVWIEGNEPTEIEKDAKEHLEREIDRQIHTDGVSIEHAINYQLFVGELFGLVLYVANATKDSFSTEYKGRLVKLVDFLTSCTDEKGDFPSFGDSDDGMTLSLGENKGSRVADLEQLLYGYEKCSELSNGPLTSIKSKILSGPLSPDYVLTKSPVDASNKLFPKGGYFIYRAPQEKGELISIFDVGNNGDDETAAHAHTDALSLYVSVNGMDLLTDRGTFSYVDSENRLLERSTQQHNTLCFGEDSQSEYLNRFAWGKRSKTIIESVINTKNQVEVSGLVHWSNGKIHRRAVRFSEDRMIVDDSWQGRVDGETCYITFVLGVGIEVSSDTESKVVLKSGEQRVAVKTSNGVLEVLRVNVSKACYESTESNMLRIFFDNDCDSNTVEFVYGI